MNELSVQFDDANNGSNEKASSKEWWLNVFQTIISNHKIALQHEANSQKCLLVPPGATLRIQHIRIFYSKWDNEVTLNQDGKMANQIRDRNLLKTITM